MTVAADPILCLLGQPASLCVRAQTRAGHLGSRERTPLEGRCLGNPGVQISRGTG